MDKCYLFAQLLDDHGCFCLKITDQGDVVSPPEHRTFAQIKALQEACTTTLVESTTKASIIELELPWLPERKARTAIPFALEDKVAQPIDALHFAFDKLRYHNNRYVVSVLEKKRMHALMHLLQEQDIQFDAITLDWFALPPHEALITDGTLLVNNDAFKGALTGTMAQQYLQNHPIDTIHLFTDSSITCDASNTPHNEHSTIWISKALMNTKPLNLCQGEMHHGTNLDWIKRGYQIAGALGIFWLVSLLVVNALSLHSINKKTRILDQQIATIYRAFFPEAKQVISPKFRISQLLGESASGGQARFWFLLNQFASAMGDSSSTIEHLRYQNNTLLVTLVSSDFSQMEFLENRLKKSGLKVKQTQASTRDQQVVANLELM